MSAFEIFSPSGETVVLSGRKHKALVALVVLAKRKTISRREILGILWGSRSEKQARDSLKSLLSQLSNTFRNSGGEPIIRNRTHVFIDCDDLEVDVWDLLENPRNLSATSMTELLVKSRPDTLLESITIKENGFEEFLSNEKRTMQVTYEAQLRKYLGEAVGRRDSQSIKKLTKVMFEFDVSDEYAHRAMMQLYINEKQSSLAIKQFRNCEMLLKDMWGESPSKETIDLLESIRSGSTAGTVFVDSETKVTSLDPSRVIERESQDTVSLAVAPFEVLVKGFEDQHIGGYLQEELSLGCSKFKWFRIMPTDESSNWLSSQSGNWNAHSRPRYIVKGKIRSLNNETILSLELNDLKQSQSVWAFRSKIDFSVTSEIESLVALVVSSIDVNLRAYEVSNVYKLDKKSLTGYQCLLRVISNMYDLENPQIYDETESLLEKAKKLCSNSAWYYSTRSLWKMLCNGQTWVADSSAELKQAGMFAREAIKRDPEDAQALAILGHYLSFWEKRLDEGRVYLDKSVRNNPYSAFALILSAANYAYAGDAQRALEELSKIENLYGVETHLNFMYNSAHCIAYLIDRDLEKALIWGKYIVTENPGFVNGYKQYMVALGHLQKRTQSKKQLEMLLNLQPDFSVDDYIKQLPFKREEDRKFYQDGLIAAGGPTNGGGQKPALKVVK